MNKEKIIAKYGTDITQLNIANVRKWVRALRSGKYKQTLGALYESNEDSKDKSVDTFCVLGVAAHLAGDTNEELKGDSQLSSNAREWLGVEDSNPTIGKLDAIGRNDDENQSFKQIAHAIEHFWIKPYQKYKHCFLKQKKEGAK